jgi:flagellar hook-associated protein 2
LTSQSTELGKMSTIFANLQTAIQGIDQAVSGSSFTPTVSDPTVLVASTSDGAQEGNYSVLVTNAGAYSTSLSTSSWVDTPGAAQTYSLSVGGNTYSITPTDNSVASVASAINSQQGTSVQATVVNVGSSATPDYRISLQSTTLDSDPVDLQLNGSSLQTQQVTGQPAQYQVNNSGLTVTSNTSTVTISPGLTVQLLKSSTTPDNITVERSSTSLANALTNFTSAYNAAATEVTSQRGQSGGPLQGQSIVFDLAQALGSIGTYSSSSGSAVSGLTDLGLSLGQNGQLTFNESTLLGADLTNSAAINSFLGSIATGGFLQNVNTTLTGLVDPTSGEITNAQTAMTNELSHIGTEISTQQAQVSLLQTNLTNQAAAADALISSMEQTYSYISELFTSTTANENAIANGG